MLRVWLKNGRAITADGAEDMHRAILCDRCPCPDDPENPDPENPDADQVITISLDGCDYDRKALTETTHIFKISVPDAQIKQFFFSSGGVTDLGCKVLDLRGGTFTVELRNSGVSLELDTFDFELIIHLPPGRYNLNRIAVTAHTFSGSATRSEYRISVSRDGRKITEEFA